MRGMNKNQGSCEVLDDSIPKLKCSLEWMSCWFFSFLPFLSKNKQQTFA